MRVLRPGDDDFGRLQFAVDRFETMVADFKRDYYSAYKDKDKDLVGLAAELETLDASGQQFHTEHMKKKRKGDVDERADYRAASTRRLEIIAELVGNAGEGVGRDKSEGLKPDNEGAGSGPRLRHGSNERGRQLRLLRLVAATHCEPLSADEVDGIPN
jgi:hypothetical protein